MGGCTCACMYYSDWNLVNHMYTFFPHNLQVDADFAVNLLGELVRAYLAATNILYQVSQSVHLSKSAIYLFFFFFSF